MKKKILSILLMLPAMLAHSQDPHFSQFYEAPLLLNPARAGIINGTYQLSGIYRSQWKDVTVPFKTLSGTLNLNVPAGKNKNNIVGIAISDFADKSGDATYTTNHLSAAFSFHRNFGENFNRYLGFGLMTGFASTSFDVTELTFDENYQGGTNTEVVANEKGTYFDVSAGVEYNFLDDDHHFNAGIACYHINEPTLSYSENAQSVIYRKFVADVGYAGTLTDLLEVMPRAACFLQGPSKEIILGADLKFKLTQSTTTNYAVYTGVYYRYGDAIIPKFRLDMGDLSFSFSYDFTTSQLSEISGTAGGPEIALIYIGRIKGISAGRIYNPRF